MGAKAALFKTQEFSFNEAEAEGIKIMVEKQNIKIEVNENEEKDSLIDSSDPPQSKEDVGKLIVKLNELVKIVKPNIKKGESFLKVEEFEKDNNSNYHIDFIYASSNMRALNYGIPVTPWIDVKLSAGKIIPALVTTTAVVAAAQTLNLIKLCRFKEREKFRNYYFNLALPYIQMSEPGEPKSFKISESLEINEWTRWEIRDKDTTVQGLIDNIFQNYNLQVRDIMKGNQVIYMSVLYSSEDKKEQKEQLLNTKLSEFSDVEDWEYIDINIICTQNEDHNKIVEQWPIVRVYFKE